MLYTLLVQDNNNMIYLSAYISYQFIIIISYKARESIQEQKRG